MIPLPPETSAAALTDQQIERLLIGASGVDTALGTFLGQLRTLSASELRPDSAQRQVLMLARAAAAGSPKTTGLGGARARLVRRWLRPGLWTSRSPNPPGGRTGEPQPAGQTTHREAGAAMIELALVFSLLVMLLVGTVTAAISFSRNNSIENAAREASRYAATLPDAADTDWLRNVRDVARAAAQGNLETTVPGQYICVAFYNGSAWSRLTDTAGVEATAAQECFTDSLPADQPRVQVVTERDSTVQAVVFSTDVNLRAEAAARYER